MLKQRLADGEQLLGLFVMFSAPALVEMAGYAGFDFVIIDMEHGPTGHEELHHCLRAGDSAGVECVVRVPRHGYGDIQRALDAGAAGILAPHIETPEEAAALANACLLPPGGRRGTVYSARSGDYGFLGVDTTRAQAAEVLVVAQIEDGRGVDTVQEIAATDGIDCIFVGPADLAASLGLGRDAAATIQELVRNRIRPAAVQAGSHWGSFASSAEDARRLTTEGAALTAVSATALIGGALGATVQTFHAELPHR